ncbi:MAG TPA: CPBP family intramembrane glutamic endopeptidase [Candidatus Limnocylindrales bacterium]|nr:CPBP family intramembrane glutamic endopeptidase [Candidatus Limnocylindrales bacterium]
MIGSVSNPLLLDQDLAERCNGSPRWTIARTAIYSGVIVTVSIATQLFAIVLTLGVALAGDPELDMDAWFARPLDTDGLYLSIAAVTSTLVGIPLIGLLAARRESNPWSFLGVTPASFRATMAWCIAIVALQFAARWLAAVLGQPPSEYMTTVYQSSSDGALLALALVAAAPLLEEIFFRGFLLSALESTGIPATAAALASALAWSLMHVQYSPYDVATIFLMGLMLGAARSRTRSVVPCIAMHSLNNALALAALAAQHAPA